MGENARMVKTMTLVKGKRFRMPKMEELQKPFARDGR